MKFPKDSEFVCVTYWDEALYGQALEWVDENRRVAFVSEVERVSEDRRVKIYLLESPLQIGAIARRIAWSAVLKKMCVIGDGAIREEVERCHLGAHLVLSEAAGYWVEPMKNARLNDGSFRRGMGLKGAFEGVPAVIVGAGPSLEKNRHLLKEFEKKGLIFAGGSALNVIDVEPHFAASIDAEAPYRQFKMHPFAEAPFCYQARMNSDNYSLVHGERLLFPDSSSSAINWIYGEGEFDGGWTVGNFLTAIAVHMGCSPVIFLGMDLSYENGRKYAEIDADAPDGLIEARGRVTQRDWLMSAMWTEELGKGRDFINSTGGGLLNLPEIEFEEVLRRCASDEDLRKRVHGAIQNLPQVVENRWEEWDASLRNCKKKIDSLETEVVYQKLLYPLWQIWMPIFEREGGHLELHQRLFFQKVIEEHESFVLPKRRSLLLAQPT